ncbi:MAG: polyprenol phosphomannose-dependent alpha 1,6 mannosyltransferase MptB, partial [Actinomycetota bacterium]|nr:polyprenol phosphomannose-dependent alpha 1,6 mannosyltransferase MptB [Actinomycetota bacterium]
MTDNAAPRLLTAPASTRWSEAVTSAWAVPAVRSGTWGSGLILVGSLTPAFLPEGNALTKLWLLRDLQYGPGRILATGLLLLGVFVLLRAWLRLYSRDDGVDVAQATLGLWSLPLLLAPPLFSSDAYSYAAQGRIVRQGFDPYSVGPGLLGGQFAAQVDPLWLWTPAPYGPLALQIQRVVVDLMGNNPYAAAVGMRLPAIAALVVIVVLLPRVATALGRNARFALWLGVLNPLTVLHLLGGAHNDVIMIAFVVAALWFATQHRLVWAALLVALAASVKQPAIVAVIAVGVLAAPPPTTDRVFAWPWNAWPAPFRSSFRPVWPAWAPRSAWTRVQVLHVAAAAAVALAGFVVITAVSGLGYGWVGAMHVPGEVRTYLAPSTALGSLGEGLLRLTGYPTAAGYAMPALRITGLVLGAVAVGWIILNRAARQPVTSLVLMLLTIVVCAPSLHPWYILWGGVLLGLTRVDRRTLRISTWITALFACYGVIDFAVHNGLVAFGVSAGLALL